ncbi:hypothetical protein DIPPA_33250 [Diplonema papillatum]|nr:hypothetical protein DIPPA_33250 [Diplonema papillatum]
MNVLNLSAAVYEERSIECRAHQPLSDVRRAIGNAGLADRAFAFVGRNGVPVEQDDEPTVASADVSFPKRRWVRHDPLGLRRHERTLIAFQNEDEPLDCFHAGARRNAAHLAALDDARCHVQTAAGEEPDDAIVRICTALDATGSTAVHISLSRGHLAFLESVLEQVSAPAVSLSFLTRDAFVLAAVANRLSVVRWMVENCAQSTAVVAVSKLFRAPATTAYLCRLGRKTGRRASANLLLWDDVCMFLRTGGAALQVALKYAPSFCFATQRIEKAVLQVASAGDGETLCAMLKDTRVLLAMRHSRLPVTAAAAAELPKGQGWVVRFLVKHAKLYTGPSRVALSQPPHLRHKKLGKALYVGAAVGLPRGRAALVEASGHLHCAAVVSHPAPDSEIGLYLDPSLTLPWEGFSSGGGSRKPPDLELSGSPRSAAGAAGGWSSNRDGESAALETWANTQKRNPPTDDSVFKHFERLLQTRETDDPAMEMGQGTTEPEGEVEDEAANTREDDATVPKPATNKKVKWNTDFQTAGTPDSLRRSARGRNRPFAHAVRTGDRLVPNGVWGCVVGSALLDKLITPLQGASDATLSLHPPRTRVIPASLWQRVLLFLPDSSIPLAMEALPFIQRVVLWLDPASISHLLPKHPHPGTQAPPPDATLDVLNASTGSLRTSLILPIRIGERDSVKPSEKEAATAQMPRLRRVDKGEPASPVAACQALSSYLYVRDAPGLAVAAACRHGVKPKLPLPVLLKMAVASPGTQQVKWRGERWSVFTAIAEHFGRESGAACTTLAGLLRDHQRIPGLAKEQLGHSSEKGTLHRSLLAVSVATGHLPLFEAALEASSYYRSIGKKARKPGHRTVLYADLPLEAEGGLLLHCLRRRAPAALVACAVDQLVRAEGAAGLLCTPGFAASVLTAGVLYLRGSALSVLRPLLLGPAGAEALGGAELVDAAIKSGSVDALRGPAAAHPPGGDHLKKISCLSSSLETSTNSNDPTPGETEDTPAGVPGDPAAPLCRASLGGACALEEEEGLFAGDRMRFLETAAKWGRVGVVREIAGGGVATAHLVRVFQTAAALARWDVAGAVYQLAAPRGPAHQFLRGALFSGGSGLPWGGGGSGGADGEPGEDRSDRGGGPPSSYLATVESSPSTSTLPPPGLDVVPLGLACNPPPPAPGQGFFADDVSDVDVPAFCSLFVQPCDAARGPDGGSGGEQEGREMPASDAFLSTEDVDEYPIWTAQAGPDSLWNCLPLPSRIAVCRIVGMRTLREMRELRVLGAAAGLAEAVGVQCGRGAIPGWHRLNVVGLRRHEQAAATAAGGLSEAGGGAKPLQLLVRKVFSNEACFTLCSRLYAWGTKGYSPIPFAQCVLNEGTSRELFTTAEPLAILSDIVHSLPSEGGYPVYLFVCTHSDTSNDISFLLQRRESRVDTIDGAGPAFFKPVLISLPKQFAAARTGGRDLFTNAPALSPAQVITIPVLSSSIRWSGSWDLPADETVWAPRLYERLETSRQTDDVHNEDSMLEPQSAHVSHSPVILLRLPHCTAPSHRFLAEYFQRTVC